MSSEDVQNLVQQSVQKIMRHQTKAFSSEIKDTVKEVIMDQISDDLRRLVDNVEQKQIYKLEMQQRVINRVEEECNQLRGQLTDLIQVVDRMPSMTTYDKITFAINQIQSEVIPQVMNKADITRVMVVEQVQQQAQQEIQKIEAEIKYVEKDFHEKTEKMTKEKKSSDSSIQEIKQDILSWQQKLSNKIIENQDRITKQHAYIETLFDRFNQRLLSFATQVQLHTVSSKFAEYATLADFDSLREEVLPLVRQCRMDLKNFNIGNQEMKEAIITFDKTISQKADRFSIVEIKQWCQSDYVSMKQLDQFRIELRQKFKEFEDEVAETKDELLRLKQEKADYVSKLVAQDISKRMKKYEKITHDFSIFFNQDSLQKELDTKLQIRDLQNVASKTELLQIANYSELLDKKIKQIALMVTEISKSLMPINPNRTTYNSKETLQSKIARREILHRNTQLTYRWINDAKVDDQNSLLYNSTRHQNEILDFTQLHGPETTGSLLQGSESMSQVQEHLHNSKISQSFQEHRVSEDGRAYHNLKVIDQPNRSYSLRNMNSVEVFKQNDPYADIDALPSQVTAIHIMKANYNQSAAKKVKQYSRNMSSFNRRNSVESKLTEKLNNLPAAKFIVSNNLTSEDVFRKATQRKKDSRAGSLVYIKNQLEGQIS